MHIKYEFCYNKNLIESLFIFLPNVPSQKHLHIIIYDNFFFSIKVLTKKIMCGSNLRFVRKLD